MNRTLFIIAITFSALFMSGCKHPAVSPVFYDTPVSGTIKISVDESFEPVIREQIAMYESSFPGTRINAEYKSEANCLRDFFSDSSVRLVIITRGLTRPEEKYMTDSLQYAPGWNAVASDAVAVIVPKNSPDTLLSKPELFTFLTGKSERKINIVFDGLTRTSTLRYVEDSILRGGKIDTSLVKAVKTSDEVIEYISTHENCLGFIGINRIGNPEEPKQVTALKKVTLAHIKCDACVNTPYVMPAQESIQNHMYPLVRGLYYMIKENHKGLGSGFTAFLKYERGQLIFRRAYLGPVMDFEVRNVQINEKLPE